MLQLSYFAGFEVLNLATGSTRRSHFPFAARGKRLKPKEYPNAAAAHGIAVSGSTVCAAGTISNYVATVTLAECADASPVGQAPGEALTGPGGNYCFVTSRGPTGLARPSRARWRRRVRHQLSHQAGCCDGFPSGAIPRPRRWARSPKSTLRTAGFIR